MADSVIVTLVPARNGVVGVTSMQLPGAPPAGMTSGAVIPLTVNVALTLFRLAAPAILQIFRVEALFVNVAIVAFEASPAGTVKVPAPSGRLLDTSRLAGNDAMSVTLVAGDPV